MLALIGFVREVFTNEHVHKTLQTIVFAIAAVFVARAIFVHPPPPAPQVALSPAPATPHPIAHEAQAAVDAANVIAHVQGGQVPVYAQAATRVVHDCFVGFTAAQCFAIMQGTRPKTAPVMKVSANLVGPSPAPTPTPGAFTQEQIDTMLAVVKAGTAATLSDPNTHIAVTAKLDYAEVPTSKLGALLTPAGSGIGFDVAQRKRFVLIAGAIERGSHISPVLGVHWKIPHTSLSCGPAVYYDHQLRPQASCATYF